MDPTWRSIAALPFLAAMTGVPPVGPDAPRAPAVESVALSLVIDGATNPGQYSVEATFRFRLHALESDLHFLAPDARDVGALGRIELNGRRLDPGRVNLVPHPRLRREAFRLRVSGRGDGAIQELLVRGPLVPMPADGLVRWGGWHPVLTGWDVPVAIDLTVRTDTSMEVIASGVPVETHRSGDRLESRWRSAQPQGWTFLAIGRYARETTRRGTLGLEIVHPDPAVAGNDSLATRALDVLTDLSERFGAPTVGTFRLIAFPRDETLRFAHDGLVGLSTQSFAPMLRSPEYLLAVLGHEFSHHWWGDQVRPVGRGGGWLSEGLAEYSRHLVERALGGDTLSWSYRNLLVLTRFASGAVPPILAAESSQPGTEEIAYQKGAFVWRMLEEELGVNRLEHALRDLVVTGRHGPVALSTVTALLEQHAGRPLAWFFDQWLHRETGPLLSVVDHRVVAAGRGYRVNAAIRQPSPPYRLALPVRVYLDSGAVDTMLVVHDTVTRLVLHLPARPRRLVLDPDSRVFKWFERVHLPITFADAWTAAASGGVIHVEVDPGSVPDTVVTAFRGFFDSRFGSAARSADTATAGRVLLGAAAARYRRLNVAWLPEAPLPEELRTYITRDVLDAGDFVIGIEGAWPDKWPEVVPQVAWREIRYREGRMAGASTPAPPRIVVVFDP